MDEATDRREDRRTEDQVSEGTAPRKPGVPPHQPPLEEAPKRLEDEEAEESFPSSDPPATGGPGV